MAIRYSGDVEIRVLYKDGVYKGAVRGPGFNARGELTPSEARVRASNRTSSEAYDQAAMAFLRSALVLAKRKGKSLYPSEESGRVILRRTFQSPCPIRT